MFSRGRMDHFALLAPDEAAFRELRHRIEAAGAADGDVRDMHSHWIMGLLRSRRRGSLGDVERQDSEDADMLERAEWTTVELDD
jgi:hypothetical protein